MKAQADTHRAGSTSVQRLRMMLKDHTQVEDPRAKL